MDKTSQQQQTDSLFRNQKNQSLFEITTVDIEERSKLQIADGDRSFMELSENINKQNINNLKQQCILHHFMIKHLTADDFEIFELPVYSQKSLYLFKLNNSLLSPLCFKSSGIMIPNNIEKCYEDIEVNFIINNTTKMGFLNKNNIISEVSNTVNCSTVTHREIHKDKITEKINKSQLCKI